MRPSGKRPMPNSIQAKTCGKPRGRLPEDDCSPGRAGAIRCGRRRSSAMFWLYCGDRVQPALIYSCATITNFPAFYQRLGVLPAKRRGIPAASFSTSRRSPRNSLSTPGPAPRSSPCWHGRFPPAPGICCGRLACPGRGCCDSCRALLVLAVHARYSYHFPYLVGALASLAFACLYVMLASGIEPSAAMSPSTSGFRSSCTSSGQAAFLPFAALCAAYELRRRRWRPIGLYLLVAASCCPTS